MKIKIYIVLALLAICTVFLFISLLFSDGGLFLRTDLTSDYSLHKHFFANKYSLIRNEDGKVAIIDIGDWIITEQYIYGRIKMDEKYFLLNRESGLVENFFTMQNLSLKLRQLGMKTYDIGDEESFVHLKYHKRIYPLKK
jgi:hypothetical protein